MSRKSISALLLLCISLGLLVMSTMAKAVQAERTVLVTTFPIYQIVRNVTHGYDGVKVELMLPSQMGCPHDYALTPQDMQKLAKADILVANGLGLEEFLGAPVKRANPNIALIDSSGGIKETLQYSGGHDHGHDHDQAEAQYPAGESFEWAGAFELDPGVYRWSFAKVEGNYAEPTMKMAVVASQPQEAIEKAEEKASKLFNSDGHPLKNGGRLLPEKLYLLQFEPARETTVFEVKIDRPGTYVFFTEHLPTEFGAGEHVISVGGGKEVKPVAQEPEAGEGRHHGEEHHDDGHDHQHAGDNPHLFASPRMSARIAMNIAAELSKVDPRGAAVYFKNAQAYAATLNQLADEMAAIGKGLNNNRIVQPHGVFDYLARDLGLEIVAVMQPHGREPSAAEMMELVKIIREKQVGAIFTEPQYPEKVARSLSKETGIPVAMLDPVASGPENAPLTYYEEVMRQNMKTLASTLMAK